MIRFNRGAQVIVLFSIGVAAAFGQVATGTISGTVKDTSGASLPGAHVVVLNQDTGIARPIDTDTAGHFAAPDLGLGNYRITATHEGFQTEVRSGVVLTVGQQAVVDFSLGIGAVTQTVEVSGQAASVETTNATVSGLVNSDQIRDLPLNGRSIDSLALLSPGTFQTAARNNALTMGMGLRLSVNGGRQDANLFLIDGTVANDHASNGPNSAAGQALGVEGILEFRVLTHNYSAEYGRNSGGIISEVTRSGTNTIHGSVYEFLRNNYFDARNFFNPGNLPPFERNQFGGAIGGPIKKDKIFYFLNYEGLRSKQGLTEIATVPDNNSRQGLVPCTVSTTTTCNTATGLTQVPINPIMAPYLALFPASNGLNFGDGTGQWISTYLQPSREDYGLGRVDYRISDKDTLYARYISDRSTATLPRPLPTFVSEVKGSNNFLVLSESHIFSATTVNEFHTSFNRTNPGGGDHPIGTIDPSLSFVPGQPFGKIQFQVNQNGPLGGQGLTTLGLMFAPSGPNEQKFTQNNFQQSDTISVIRGSHSFKFGGDFQRIQLNQGSLNATGAYTFGGLLQLLAGTPSQFQATLPGAVSVRGFRRADVSWFIQDDYRVGPHLTLNLGLRHEFFTSPTEVGGRIGQLINITDTAETRGVSFQTRKDNFSPRVGIAWDPFGNGKTAIRAGGGIFYNFIDGRTWYINVDGWSLFSTTTTINTPPFPLGLSNGIPIGSATITSMTYNPKEPTVGQYNVDVQQQLTSSLSLRVGYVGSTGYHMAHLVQPNVRIPQVQANGTLFFPTTGPVVNPNFASGAMQKVLFDGRYNYNGLQTALQKTLSSGLQFQVSYTWSKAMSDSDQITNTGITSSAASELNLFNRAQDYSLSSFDQRHTVVTNVSYRLPFDRHLKSGLARGLLGGWGLSGIYSYGSGMPMNVQTGFNQSKDLDTLLTDRPNYAPGYTNSGVTAGCQGIPAGQALGTASRWFDPCAYVLQPVGTFGNVGRNTITMPPTNNIDASLVKNTAITEKFKLEFRAEFFNALNHTQLGLPGRTIFTSSGTRPGNDASIASTAIDNREIQLGLKIIF